MSKSEYIIWKCETMENIEKTHPDFSEQEVIKYFEHVEDYLLNNKIIVKEF